MRHFALIACLLLPAPGLAQDETDRGLSLMERGAQLLMEGLLKEMDPALDELQTLAERFGPALQDFATQMGPALRDLLDEVEDWSVYHPPEMLENGDIIIRRKQPDTLPEPDTDGDIEI